MDEFVEDLAEALMVQVKFKVLDHVLDAKKRLVLNCFLECVLDVPKHHVPNHLVVAANLHE